MASSTRGGKRGSKRKKINLTPSKTGAYIYQSDRARKSMKESASRDSLDNAIDRAYTKRMHSGELTPEESGTRSARTTIDRIHDSHFEGPDYEKPRKMEGGGRVARIRAKQAADTVGRKMDKDNLPHSKAMQGKKKKSQGLMNSLLKMEHGGEVCRGNGRAYQGKPKKVQVR